MKIIDWNRPLTFLDLFDNISIHSINNNCFDQNNPTWISSVTHDFGTEADIANNLLTLFKKRVGALRCYRACLLPATHKSTIYPVAFLHSINRVYFLIILFKCTNRSELEF
jgi:hypothetical protein